MTKIKMIVAAIVVVFSMNASAGFITGAIVGAAITSSSNSKNDIPKDEARIIAISDNSKVLHCRDVRDIGCNFTGWNRDKGKDTYQQLNWDDFVKFWVSPNATVDKIIFYTCARNETCALVSWK